MKIKLLTLLVFFVGLLSMNAQTSFSYSNFSFCSDDPMEVPTITGQQGGIFSSSPPGGLSLDAVTGAIYPIASTPGAYVVQYTTPPSGSNPSETYTITILIQSQMTPVFAPIPSLCYGATVPVLPTTSTNGITGTWSPSTISNTATTVYTFTSNPGQCAVNTTITIEINNIVQPQFGFNSNSFCLGDAPVLPTTSLNGITGTWSPAVVENNGGYIFTPDAGQCATPITEFFSVNPMPTATISSNTTVCQGQSSIIVFNGTPNAIINYTFDNNAMQTIALDSSGSAVVSLPLLSLGMHSVCLVRATSSGMSNCTSTLTECTNINVIPSVNLTPMPDVTFCGYYTLPDIQTGNYYTYPNGMGMILSPGDHIFQTQTIYVYAESACGPAQDEFQVTIIPIESPTITAENNAHHMYVDGTTIVQPILLNAGVTGNYSYQWMDWHLDIPGANSPTYLLDYHNDQFDHYISVRITHNDSGCESTSALYEVWEVPVPAPIGDSNQTFTQGQTLADVVVNGQNIQWYDGLGRNVNANPLPLSTVLADGVTYYASQTINGHESPDRLPVTVHLNVMSNTTFDRSSVVIFPNPVQDVLFVQSNEPVNHIEIYNIMGQKLIDVNTPKVTMQSLPSGVYIVQVSTKTGQKRLRVIKE
ncbi:MAG: T9SS type A sorting domain-containing protein [Flavobacteriaceae bacterium]